MRYLTDAMIAHEINYVGRSRCYCARAVSQLQLRLLARAGDSSEKRDSARYDSRKREGKNGDRREGRTGEVTEIRERQAALSRNRVSRRVRSREALGVHLRLACHEDRGRGVVALVLFSVAAEGEERNLEEVYDGCAWRMPRARRIL